MCCPTLYLAGFFLLPLLWLVNVWYFWPVLRHGRDEVIVKCKSLLQQACCCRAILGQLSSSGSLFHCQDSYLAWLLGPDTKRSLAGFLAATVVFLPWVILFAAGQSPCLTAVAAAGLCSSPSEPLEEVKACAGCVQVGQECLAKAFSTRTIWVVSHFKYLSDHSDSRYDVKQQNGLSTEGDEYQVSVLIFLLLRSERGSQYLPHSVTHPFYCYCFRQVPLNSVGGGAVKRCPRQNAPKKL